MVSTPSDEYVSAHVHALKMVDIDGTAKWSSWAGKALARPQRQRTPAPTILLRLSTYLTKSIAKRRFTRYPISVNATAARAAVHHHGS